MVCFGKDTYYLFFVLFLTTKRRRLRRKYRTPAVVRDPGAGVVGVLMLGCGRGRPVKKKKRIRSVRLIMQNATMCVMFPV